MPTSGTEGWVRIPTDLRPPNVSKAIFGDFPGLKIKEGPDGSWLFKTEEDYRRSVKPHILLSLLARGSEFESAGISRLENLAPITRSESLESLEIYAEYGRRQAETRSDDEPLWHRFHREVQVCLEPVLLSKLREFQSEGDGTDSLWLAEADQVLSRRFAFMRVLFALRHAKDSVLTENFTGLPAAEELMFSSFTAFTIYFHPLLLLNSPEVSGFTAPRPDATLIRLLTAPEPGRSRGWTDQLDFFQPIWGGSARELEVVPPSESLETREELLQWWTARVSDLVCIISDPTRHTDREGSYEPSLHVGTTLTIERIFVTAVEIMRLKTKGEVLRKILFFQLLDLLEGHGMGNYTKNLSYRTQYVQWTSLRETLPEPVFRCLSPIIESAFKALQSVEEGFWLASSRTSEGHLLVTRKRGVGQDLISIDRAVGEYLKVLRNSHHGFKDITTDPRELSYLASHTGALNNKLPDLAWWYLVRILMNPSQVAPRATASASD